VYVLVSPDGVELEEPDDCSRFHVVGRDVGPDEVAGALSGFGEVEGEHAWIEQETVRTLAEGRVADDWDDRFDAMLEYASSKGWVDEEGRVQAHIEWEHD
jgi:hypothetical protein